MTLLDAAPPDYTRERRRKKILLSILIVVLIVGLAVWRFRYWPEEHVVDKFFSALEQKNYEAAYGIWMHDPNWKQHTDKYANYSYSDFYRDWGPGGEWGLVKRHSVDCALSTKEGTGVIMQVTVNGRSEHPYLYVGKSDKSMSFSPNELRCGS
ncbi:MAG: hypothetical protein JO266_11625 [Acidobacteria bacterium]|nr:hypothetical protein [Acidobacteriota bacterium]